VTSPKPILYCKSCGHDLTSLIETPWIRTCPECGKKFDPDFVYEGNARNKPEPNGPLPKPRKLAEGEEHD
jgi:predicted amidophosphoribosyltransferase